MLDLRRSDREMCSFFYIEWADVYVCVILYSSAGDMTDNKSKFRKVLQSSDICFFAKDWLDGVMISKVFFNFSGTWTDIFLSKWDMRSEY